MYKFLKGFFIAAAFLLSGCGDNKDNVIKFGTSLDYPPFEFMENGQPKGFDIDLAHLIAKELGKTAVIEDKSFSSILAAINAEQIDAGIATITISPEREKNFDFSKAYYFENLSAVFMEKNPITSSSQLISKKVACQIGTTTELWLKKHVPEATIIAVDNNNQAIELLKAGHADIVLIDASQGKAFSDKNPGLSSNVIAQADQGFGIAFKTGSHLVAQVNAALDKLEAKGELQKLKEKWIGVAK